MKRLIAHKHYCLLVQQLQTEKLQVNADMPVYKFEILYINSTTEFLNSKHILSISDCQTTLNLKL
jgi:hypothetical protein